VATAERRVTEIDSDARRADSRAGTLHFAQKRMAPFEERVAIGKRSRRHLNQALEQVHAASGTLDASQTTSTGLSEVAEKTVDECGSPSPTAREKERRRRPASKRLALDPTCRHTVKALEHRKEAGPQADFFSLFFTLERLAGSKGAGGGAVEHRGGTRPEALMVRSPSRPVRCRYRPSKIDAVMGRCARGAGGRRKSARRGTKVREATGVVKDE